MEEKKIKDNKREWQEIVLSSWRSAKRISRAGTSQSGSRRFALKRRISCIRPLSSIDSREYRAISIDTPFCRREKETCRDIT